MLLKSLNFTAAKAAQSRERIDKVLAHVAALLADGRPYLSGTSNPKPPPPSVPAPSPPYLSKPLIPL